MGKIYSELNPTYLYSELLRSKIIVSSVYVTKGLFKCSAPAAYFSIRSTSRNTNKVTNRKYPSFLLYIQ